MATVKIVNGVRLGTGRRPARRTAQPPKPRTWEDARPPSEPGESPCHCSATGQFVFDSGAVGVCFGCDGKGYQDAHDREREARFHARRGRRF